MSVNINIKDAIKRFGDKTIIPGLSLEINKGEFFTLLGPSGCGKTTLLRMIAGFNSIEGGEIFFDETLINYIPPHKRNIGMVFQNYAIFPHLSVRDNVGFGLKERKIKNPIYTNKIEEIFNAVQIRDLIDRMPSQMSGGQQQRIALARLMDEPLSNLDAKLRVEMRTVIKGIQRENKITTVYVTHDQEEALSMSDRIAIMNYGEIQQIGTPREIYGDPKNIFVATFIGSSNILKGEIIKEKATYSLKIGNGLFKLDESKFKVNNNQKVKVNIRPHEFYFSNEGLKGTIIQEMYLGSQITYQIKLESEEVVEIHTNISNKFYKIDDEVVVNFNIEAINIFDEETEQSLSVV